jgi:MFS family permease
MPTALPAAVLPWYSGVTRYQWTVLALASAGWLFDVFEGQIFGSCMNEATPVLLQDTVLQGRAEFFINLCIGTFLAGGAVGGVLFGILADRWGRRGTMAVTILLYSVFTGLTALTQNWWQMVILRFLVGLGVGGEWAVAAAVVAEVFPARARPAASGIFHASSVLGTFLAAAVGAFIVAGDKDNGWRWAFLTGVLPALLVFWVRVSMREPTRWVEARALAQREGGRDLGLLRDLFDNPLLRKHTLLATSLAVIGLATFWGVHFRGKDVLRLAYIKQEHLTPDAVLTSARVKHYEMLGMVLVTAGGALGLLSFAPLSQRLGRRPAFVLFHAGALVLTGVVFFLADSAGALLYALPVFGYFTLGMHAGYAVYFPELFPTRLRSTGVGFCFNVARIVGLPVLLLFGWLMTGPLAMHLVSAMWALALLYVVGVILVGWCPETRGQPLPE